MLILVIFYSLSHQTFASSEITYFLFQIDLFFATHKLINRFYFKKHKGETLLIFRKDANNY